MRAYTAFFESDNTPFELKTEDGAGSFRLIDGIAVAIANLEFGFALDGQGPLWIPFSKTDPPEIIRNYVFTCDINDGDFLTVSHSRRDIPTQRPLDLVPALVRVHTRCMEESQKIGFAKIIVGEPKIIASTARSNWSDNLVIMSKGDAIQIRPAGTRDPTEWVVEYKDIGLVSFTLEDFYDRKA